MNEECENSLVSGIYSINDKGIELLSNEPIELIISSEKLVGKVEVIIQIQPKLRLIFQVSLTEQSVLRERRDFAILLNAFCEEDKIIIKFPSRGILVEAKLINNKNGIFTFTPHNEPIFTGSGKNLRSIIFHMPNFIKFLGKQDFFITESAKRQRIGRILLSADGWRVTVNSVSNIDKIIESLKSRGGINITHVGMIEREENTCFTAEEANSFLSSLMYFFSFCRGLWCPPILPVGFDLLGEKVWEEWGIRQTSNWQSTLSWFDAHHAEVLSKVFPGFISYWENDVWHKPIKLAIYWYIQSNVGSSGTDGSIVLAQAALELLSWVYLVEDKGYLSSDGFKQLRVSDQLRLLLSHLDIPLNIPRNLTQLIEISKRKSWQDGPHVFTDIRNDIVHPNKKKGYGKEELPLFEIWNLGLWYIELALLRLFNYTGLYAERLQTGRWLGDVRLVPWSTKNNRSL